MRATISPAVRTGRPLLDQLADQRTDAGGEAGPIGGSVDDEGPQRRRRVEEDQPALGTGHIRLDPADAQGGGEGVGVGRGEHRDDRLTTGQALGGVVGQSVDGVRGVVVEQDGMVL